MSQSMRVALEDEYDQEEVINIEHNRQSTKNNQKVSVPEQIVEHINFQESQAIPESDNKKYSSQTDYNAEQSIFMKKTETYQLPTLNQFGDPPLLEDIGIDPSKIGEKLLIIIKMDTPPQEIVENPDLTGPIFIAMVFGMLLLLQGKLHFGDIYAVFIIGNILAYLLFNFMTKTEVIPLYSIMSSLGYGLLPMIVLGMVGILSSLKNTYGVFLCLGMSIWASVSASKFFEGLMKITLEQNKSFVIIYPLFLFYMSFAMIVIF